MPAFLLVPYLGIPLWGWISGAVVTGVVFIFSWFRPANMIFATPPSLTIELHKTATLTIGLRHKNRFSSTFTPVAGTLDLAPPRVVSIAPLSVAATAQNDGTTVVTGGAVGKGQIQVNCTTSSPSYSFDPAFVDVVVTESE